MAYWVVIFTLTHWPDIDDFAPSMPSGFDKLVHGSMYAGWAVCWFWLLSGSSLRVRRSTLAWIVVGGAAYGVFDELTQAVVGRTPDVGDFLADMIGITAALVLLRWWSRYRLRPQARFSTSQRPR